MLEYCHNALRLGNSVWETRLTSISIICADVAENDILVHMKTTTKSVIPVPARQGGLPASWKKAAGILRGKKPNPLKELREMRKEWEERMKALEKRSRA
jgi:hypothetical protein